MRNRKSELIKITIPPDCIAFQIGETAQIHSGGILQATPHAVKGTYDLIVRTAWGTMWTGMEMFLLKCMMFSDLIGDLLFSCLPSIAFLVHFLAQHQLCQVCSASPGKHLEYLWSQCSITPCPSPWGLTPWPLRPLQLLRICPVGSPQFPRDGRGRKISGSSQRNVWRRITDTRVRREWIKMLIASQFACRLLIC